MIVVYPSLMNRMEIVVQKFEESEVRPRDLKPHSLVWGDPIHSESDFASGQSSASSWIYCETRQRRMS